jgi:CyaY protein
MTLSNENDSNLLSDAAYRQAAAKVLAQIEVAVDRWLQDDVIDIDCARTGDMLTLTLPNRSQIIINLQPPLKELWIAARSGGYHFAWQGDANWVDGRTDSRFIDVLARSLTEQAGMALTL